MAGNEEIKTLDELFGERKEFFVHIFTKDFKKEKKGSMIFLNSPRPLITMDMKTYEQTNYPTRFLCRIRKSQFKTLKELNAFLRQKEGEADD